MSNGMKSRVFKCDSVDIDSVPSIVEVLKVCSPVLVAKKREYYQRHADEINAKKREYYQRHADEINAKKKEY